MAGNAAVAELVQGRKIVDASPPAASTAVRTPIPKITRPPDAASWKHDVLDHIRVARDALLQAGPAGAAAALEELEVALDHVQWVTDHFAEKGDELRRADALVFFDDINQDFEQLVPHVHGTRTPGEVATFVGALVEQSADRTRPARRPPTGEEINAKWDVEVTGELQLALGRLRPDAPDPPAADHHLEAAQYNLFPVGQAFTDPVKERDAGILINRISTARYALEPLITGKHKPLFDIAAQLGMTLANGEGRRLLESEPLRPLTPREVASAQAYYASQKHKYSKRIIEQIQAKLLLPPTGQVDAETVQAVARFQLQHPPLVIDGRVGADTLAVMFPVGLAQGTSVTKFTKEAKGLMGTWPALTPKQRVDTFCALANRHLATAGVPAMRTGDSKDLGTGKGGFDRSSWTMFIPKETSEANRLEGDDAKDFVATVYHEARHAESIFRVARWAATQGMSAAQIQHSLKIPDFVALAAHAAPFELGSIDALQAQEWFESDFLPGGAEKRDQLRKGVRKAKESFKAATAARQEAEEACKKDPSRENQAALDAARAKEEEAKAEYERVHIRYQQQVPLEFDAYYVDAQVMKKWDLVP